MPPTITARIEAGMAARELSLTRLAEQSGIPRMTLSRRLVDPETFTIGELERVAVVLGTTPRVLLLGDAA